MGDFAGMRSLSSIETVVREYQSRFPLTGPREARGMRVAGASRPTRYGRHSRPLSETAVGRSCPGVPLIPFDWTSSRLYRPTGCSGQTDSYPLASLARPWEGTESRRSAGWEATGKGSVVGV